MQLTDTLISKAPQEWGLEDLNRVLELYKNLNVEGMMHTYALHGYYQVISDMREFEYTSNIVQRVVRLLYEYLVEHNTEPELNRKITPKFMAQYTAFSFLEGDVATLHRRNYGEEGCAFIANAIAYFGGYASYNDIE